ncbi:MAG: ABC transporter permease subunit [Ilumatobacteraceae bacterium]
MTETSTLRPNATNVARPHRSRSRRHRITALARHEVRAAARSGILVALLGILVTVTTVSVIIAAVDYHSQLADYQRYVDAATTGGVQQIAPSPLRPLSLLRSSIEYLEIIGAVIAITLGYLSVARERSNGTLSLLRSRPVTAGEHALGSLLGSVTVIAMLVVVTSAVGVVVTGLVGGDWINGAQAFRLLLATVAAVLYMTVFYCVGAIATARTRNPAVGLMIALGVWLVVVMILPQLGDTLDADNQIPGGLFKALGLVRADETTILQHFHVYETTRIGIEEASLESYERFAFAMTDVLDKYQGFSLRQLAGEKWHDIAWLLAYPAVALTALVRSFGHLSTLDHGERSS